MLNGCAGWHRERSVTVNRQAPSCRACLLGHRRVRWVADTTKGRPPLIRKPRLIDVDAASFDSLPCCGIKSPTHPGRRQKRCWLQANAKFGLRAKMLLAPDGKPSGYIEYLRIPARRVCMARCRSRGLHVYSLRLDILQATSAKGLGRIMVEGRAPILTRSPFEPPATPSLPPSATPACTCTRRSGIAPPVRP